MDQKKSRETRANPFQLLLPKAALAPPSLSLYNPFSTPSLDTRQPPPSFSFALFSAATLSNADRLTEDSSGPKICFNFQFFPLLLKISHRNSDLKICCAVKMTSWRGMISSIHDSIVQFKVKWALKHFRQSKHKNTNNLKCNEWPNSFIDQTLTVPSDNTMLCNCSS